MVSPPLSPLFFLLSLLTLAVILVNGWTDAPNAIASAVSSRALSFRSAAALAAVCNFGGAALSSLLHPAVADTVRGLSGFGPDPAVALAALCAALAAIVLWSVAAWRFGIPTSESHALMAGLTGSALALRGGAENVDAGTWRTILLGLVLSTGLSLLLGR
ncbi:inorganic phosphate transporter, partial [uncultured Intestinimonas sp.]